MMMTNVVSERLCWILGIALFLSVAILSGIHGFMVSALFSLLIFFIFLLTAYPISRLLFTSKIEALIFSLPIGWAIHALILSLWGKFLGVNPISFSTYLALIFATSLVLFRKKKQEIAQADPAWDTRDSLLLLIWILATVLVISVPLIHVGSLTSQGYAYRAYFNADFFRNMAVVGSLGSSGIPPNNPYFTGVPLHYYWFFHVLVAFWRTLFPSYRLDFLLVQFTLVSASIFVSTLVVVLRRYLVSPQTSVLFVAGISHWG
jgi:hypothetical protein